MHMTKSNSKKTMHPIVQFLVELLSARAGLHIKQKTDTTQKEQRRG